MCVSVCACMCCVVLCSCKYGYLFEIPISFLSLHQTYEVRTNPLYNGQVVVVVVFRYVLRPPMSYSGGRGRYMYIYRGVKF